MTFGGAVLIVAAVGTFWGMSKSREYLGYGATLGIGFMSLWILGTIWISIDSTTDLGSFLYLVVGWCLGAVALGVALTLLYGPDPPPPGNPHHHGGVYHSHPYTDINHYHPYGTDVHEYRLVDDQENFHG